MSVKFYAGALMVGTFAALAAQRVDAASDHGCNAACLEKIGTSYRAAYVKHDRSLAPFSAHVRFTENAASLNFPDGSWDVVTEEIGPALTFSDPESGGVGMYTAIMMRETAAFLAIRLKVEHGQITEIEHLLSTKRLVSGPPTPFGDVHNLVHDPVLSEPLAESERRPRAELIRLADGYFSTLARNDGTLHTTFSAHCHRIENGMETAKDGCDKAFRLGVYRFNERVRREPILVDEARGLVMFRGFIDHKGSMIDYQLTDGTQRKSPFSEPHTWSFLETFKVKNGEVGPVEADFIGSPYYTTSPWSKAR
ncbi:MAG TPA: hypothetical protein VLX90_23140 [Steroidobacteraceae bacterium]|nr:hypothetical protein [Steroidobacteraceae bacterium]